MGSGYIFAVWGWTFAATLVAALVARRRWLAGALVGGLPPVLLVIGWMVAAAGSGSRTADGVLRLGADVLLVVLMLWGVAAGLGELVRGRGPGEEAP